MDIVREAKIAELVYQLRWLHDYRQRLSAIESVAPGDAIGEDNLKEATELLRILDKCCLETGLPHVWEKIVLSGNHLVPELSHASVETELRNVSEFIEIQLGQLKFFSVHPRLTGMINHPKAFGEQVWEAFPSAREDVTEAGNCVAAGCGTAAVFHLMRTAEVGLRSLAYDRRVTLPRNVPLELATWEEIIRQLEDAEGAIRNYPKTLAREAQYAFYHHAMMQYRRFKNVFRNRIMHARESFEVDEVLGVYGDVKDFMQTLSNYIAEGKRTPEIWKGKKYASSR